MRRDFNALVRQIVRIREANLLQKTAEAEKALVQAASLLGQMIDAIEALQNRGVE